MCGTANNIQAYVRKCHTIYNCYDDSVGIWHTLNEKVKRKSEKKKKKPGKKTQSVVDKL